MVKDEMFLTYIRNMNESFSGWDFSYITNTGRVQNELMTWSYGSLLVPNLAKANTMLDMGTGGGELLSKLKPLPPKVFATEAYKPNVPIARNRLEPLGIQVYEIEEDNKLPFEKDFFDLVINRHEAYCRKEVKRVLRNKGVFITQQVGGTDCAQINDALGAPPYDEYAYWNLDYAVKELENHGFKIVLAKEEFPLQRFYDVGALVYYLKAVPWQVPNFEVETYISRLYEIHQHIQNKGYFDVRQHRFVIEARPM
ncbi:class I SAM-dependent methyltransferase [Anaerobacillus alkaliphilus]|uniref:Class I SAM-dependent methyltransferase n=1 Tax=Anaerobacillus alkaliphilus TaxID=1548597 RepID=A0A4Q0VXH7_9BACI|nr:class I SAM-dependent methyltransferase [Anaerobacillus alkaliphilus]RXJ04384.1 class I SAM-dependent methyltransferase [Anaerobacillus alkaliphilus]